MNLIESRNKHYKVTVAIAIILICLLFVPMVSFASGSDSRRSERAKAADQLKVYAGDFSAAVSVSFNPPVTIALFSVFGAIENAADYSDSVVLNGIAVFLNEIPVVNEMGKMPVANPYAAVVLVVMAVAWTVINCIKLPSAIAKYIHLEKINRVAVNAYCSLFPLLEHLTNDKLSKTIGIKGNALVSDTIDIFEKSSGYGSSRIGTYILTLVTTVVAVVFGNCIYSCIMYLETIAAGAPMKGTSLVWQIIKAFVSSILLILQIYAPIASVIICIHLAVASIFLVRVLKRLAQYYSDIYIFTILRRIFWRKKAVPRIEKRVPRRLKKLYPSMEIGMAVYTFHGYARLAKRSRVWLIKEGDRVELVYKRLIRKPYVISWSDLREKQGDKAVYLEKCLRFLRIRTEDKKIELVMSNRYKPEAEMLSELLVLKDFEIVKQENKETKKLKRQLRKERRKKGKEVGTVV